MSEAALPPTRGLQSIRWRLLSDDHLVRSATGGEQRAFAAIFERFHQELYRYCRALLRNDEEARDAVQNTMVKVLRALPGEDRQIALRPWLYRIAHNEAIALARQRTPTAELPDGIAAAPNQTAERLLETRERLRQLATDLQALPERQRGALVMRELSDMDYGEIATALGTSGGAARQTVYEARVALQQMTKGRDMECESVRQVISEHDGRLLRGRGIRAHLRGCEGCRDFQTGISQRRADLRALAPALPAAAGASLLGEVLGGSQLGGGGSLAGALGGGLGKGLAASAAAKSLAAVAATAVLGVGVADVTGLVHVHAPFGASSSGSGSSIVARPSSSSAAADAAIAEGTAAARQSAAARTRGRRARANAQHPGHGKALGKGHEKTAAGAKGVHGANGNNGQQTSASHSATAPGHSVAVPPGQTTEHSSSSGSAVKSGQTSGSGSSGTGGSGGTSKPASVTPRIHPSKPPKPPRAASP